MGAALLFGATACEQKGGPLKVENVEPNEGTTGGGDKLTIHGSGFQPGKTQAEVRFGRRRAEAVIISSPTQIQVTTPAGDKGPVDVSVMFDDGSYFKIANGFKYVPPAAPADVRKAFFTGSEKK